ncbi:MAG: molecular chaperone TorD family protein [Geminicoccaceae bacterium]|nr:molecular chaperone TorD family protein [Geminicoccaceae bacterium]
MAETGEPKVAPAGVRAALAEHIAEDLETLALLHDREPAGPMIEELRLLPVAEWFGLRLSKSEAPAVIDRALALMPVPVDDATLDELAADYADIYLVDSLHASPSESLWLENERLICQQSMFDMRDWYAHYGYEAENWRRRADDHLVLQLRFMARLAALATPDSTIDLARFLDRHTLRWIHTFAERVAARCATPWFAGVAMLTADYLETLRGWLEEAAGIDRERHPTSVELAEMRRVEPDEPVREAYVPGVAPGW